MAGVLDGPDEHDLACRDCLGVCAGEQVAGLDEVVCYAGAAGEHEDGAVGVEFLVAGVGAFDVGGHFETAAVGFEGAVVEFAGHA